PQLVLTVISGSLMHVLVPLLAGESEDRLRHDAWGFFFLIGGLFGLLAFIFYITAPWWIPITVIGFDKAGKALTIDLTRIQLIGMVFAALNGVQWAAYHARQQFIRAEISPIISSAVALLLLIWALPRFGVIAAAWISTLRMALQTLLLAPGMGKPIRPDLKSAAVQEAWKRIKPLLLGTTYYKTDPLIDRFLLSMSTNGSLSLYYLAQRLYGIANQIINKAIAAPFVPMLSKLHKAGDKEGFQIAYQKKMNQVGIISIVGLLIIIFLGQYLFSLFAGYGKVSNQNIKSLWLIMVLMSGQFVIGNLGVIMTTMFYSLGDTKSPTVIGFIAYTLGLIVKILLFYFYGILGLSLGVTIYYMLSFILMNKKINTDILKNISCKKNNP
ncbi:MAG: virulence factor MviN, partial [Candidatus Electrothrix sp. AR1]|nr:virulence factor MviN [Candidatus Electrothrix sp. AR1]